MLHRKRYYLPGCGCIILINLLHFIVLIRRNNMPGPLRLGAEGDAVVIEFRKALKSANIYGIRKLAIADSKGTERIRACKLHIVSANQGPPVYFFFAILTDIF